MIRIFAILSAGLAVVLGGLFAMVLGGFGPCAAGLSVGSIGGALVAGVIVSWLGAVLLQTRWLAALLFALPMTLGFLAAALSHQGWRCVAVLGSILLPFAAVGMFRVDHRKYRDRTA